MVFVAQDILTSMSAKPLFEMNLIFNTHTKWCFSILECADVFCCTGYWRAWAQSCTGRRARHGQKTRRQSSHHRPLIDLPLASSAKCCLERILAWIWTRDWEETRRQSSYNRPIIGESAFLVSMYRPRVSSWFVHATNECKCVCDTSLCATYVYDEQKNVIVFLLEQRYVYLAPNEHATFLKRCWPRSFMAAKKLCWV